MNRPVQDALVLVNPVRTGAPFRAAAAESGLAVVQAYTFPEAMIEEIAGEPLARLRQGSAAVYFDATPDNVAAKLTRDRFRARAVIPATEPAVVCADRLAALLGVTCNDPERVLARRDKAAMREAVAAAGLHCPAFKRVSDVGSAVEFALEHGYPVMVKTPTGASMNNVFRCTDAQQVATAVRRVLAEANLFGERTSHAVIESYVEGPEYAVNLFHDGTQLHLTDLWRYIRRDTAHGRNLYHAAVLQPTDDARAKLLGDYACDVARAVGLRFGPAHVEVKLAPRPTLMEIGARLFGIEAPVRMCEGSNFHPYRATVDVFLNGRTSVPEPVRYHEFQAHAFVINEEAEGVVVRIEGLEQIRALPSFRDWKVSAKVGGYIRPTFDMETHPLFVWLAHPDRDTVMRDLETVHRVYRAHAVAEAKVAISRR